MDAKIDNCDHARDAWPIISAKNLEIRFQLNVLIGIIYLRLGTRWEVFVFVDSLSQNIQC